MTNVTMLIHSRPRLTAQALDSLRDTPDMRLCVLGHKCTGEMQEVIDTHLPKNYTIGYTWEELGTGPLRNKVIEQASSLDGEQDYLYISDNDVWFKPGWLQHLISAYEEAWKSGYRMVGGYNHPFNGPIPKEQWIKSGDFSVYPVYALASQSILMRWSVYREFGPFCDTPANRVCQSEDVEMSNRIRAAGYKVGVISPPLLVNTGITNSFGEKIVGWELVAAQCPENILCE